MRTDTLGIMSKPSLLPSDIHAQLRSTDRDERFSALAQLAQTQQRPEPAGTNTHVHTNYSFSAFASPAEAAALAWASGVEVFGINDHYTIDGHPEFREACAALDLPATFSIESVAMDREAASAVSSSTIQGTPGRTYLCGKGVTKLNSDTAAATLRELRQHQETRNRAMVAAVDAHFQAVLNAAGPSWNDIVDQTPLGNTTERHIARAGCERIAAIAAERSESGSDWYAKLVGAELPNGDADAQNTFRSKLLKSGKPCYVDEDPAAYPALPDLRDLYLQLGAIPTYPVLGNPLTGGETDIPALCDHLAARGIYALELIPSRNTDDRVAAVLDEAAKREWPVFDGTEHNTPSMDPLLTTWGSDPRFRPAFRATAAEVLLGHQRLIAGGELGYLSADGHPRDGGYQACLAAGSLSAAAGAQLPAQAGLSRKRH